MPVVCNAYPAKAGGGVTIGRPRANNMSSDRHAPGLQRQKASRPSGVRRPSRGTVRMEALAGPTRARGVSSLSLVSGSGDRGMLGQLRRRGTFSHLVTRRRVRGEGRSFAPGGLARAVHCPRFNPLLAQPVVGSWRRPQAVPRKARAFGVPPVGELAAPIGERR